MVFLDKIRLSTCPKPCYGCATLEPLPALQGAVLQGSTSHQVDLLALHTQLLLSYQPAA